jgi:pyruvate dehydrogenase E2 component (dihydrolipoamide acetyltransferase)
MADAVAGGKTIIWRTPGGTGADCLLIHGFGSDRLSWLATTPALFPLVKVHVLDLPGHGESGTDVGDGSPMALVSRIEKAIADHGLRRTHVIGHSLGGGLALLLAAHRPDLVASLALIAPTGLGAGVERNFLKEFPEAQDADAIASLLRRLVIRPQLINGMTIERVRAQLARNGARDAQRRIAGKLAVSEEQFQVSARTVAARQLPRLVLWGENDSINPPDRERLREFGGVHHLIPGSAHLPHIESAKQVNTRLVDFLSRHTPSGVIPS